MEVTLHDAGAPSPGEVRNRFARIEATEGAEAAVRYLYELERACGYLNEAAAARAIRWTSDAPCGPLEVTVNLAKPEKDPRAIAAACAAVPPVSAASAVSARPDGDGPAPDGRGPGFSAVFGAEPAPGEPCCDLCWENEGWPGSPGHPAKPGLRIVPIELGGERWGLQFSPYAYYPEHCIALSAVHRPMKVDAPAVARLLDFVDRFPFYFIGSNAGLPVVGGSILCHDHFQGGRHVFPLMKAEIEQDLALKGLPSVRAGLVRWPASVLRLASCDRGALLAAAERVIVAWERFSDESAGILARTDAPHNAVTPILRRLPAGGDGAVGPLYVLDLVLRNNRTTPQRPWGLFHPDESLFHIKRENIGLIEVMGRAILPARLTCELPAVQRALWKAAAAGEAPHVLRERLAADPLTVAHAPWAAAILVRRRAELAAEAADVWDAGSTAAAGAQGARDAGSAQVARDAQAMAAARPAARRTMGMPRPPAAEAAACFAPGLAPATVASSPAAPDQDASASASRSHAGSARAASGVSSAPAAPGVSASNPLAPVMRDEVAQVFYRVLQATAVFKPDSTGRRARARFLASLEAHSVRP